jgi:hypothetical protein
MGVVGGLVVYYSAKTLGLTNAMLPLVKHENNESLVNSDSTLHRAAHDDN